MRTPKTIRLLPCAICFLHFAVCISLHAADGPLKLVQTIPLPGVKGRFDHFSIDTKGNRLFVAALGNNTVEVIDLAAGKPLRGIPGMSKPQGVLFVAHRNELAVANGEDGTVKFFEATNFKLKAQFTEEQMPDADNLRMDPRTGEVWIGYGEGALARIFPGHHKGTIKLAGHPESFQVEKPSHRIFVNVPDAQQIAVVDTDKDSVITNWPMHNFQANFPMALDTSDHRLFVGCRKPARLVIFDTEAGKLVSDVAISGDTDDLFYDAKRKRIYISCGEGLIDTVTQVSPDVYKPLAQTRTASGARTCFFSPDLDRLYVAVPDRVGQRAEIRVYQPE